jgi:hypothetical protein
LFQPIRRYAPHGQFQAASQPTHPHGIVKLIKRQRADNLGDSVRERLTGRANPTVVYDCVRTLKHFSQWHIPNSRDARR